MVEPPDEPSVNPDEVREVFRRTLNRLAHGSTDSLEAAATFFDDSYATRRDALEAAKRWLRVRKELRSLEAWDRIEVREFRRTVEGLKHRETGNQPNHDSSDVRLTEPAGHRLLRMTQFVFSKGVHERVFEAAILDYRAEHFEALAEGRTLHAKWIRLRGVGLVVVLALRQIVSHLVKPFEPIAKFISGR